MNTQGFIRFARPQWTAAALLSGLLLLSSHATIQADDYAIGADLSFLKQAEDRGTVFKDNGYNWIRLQLFHTPTRLPNNLEYTIALAKQANHLGYKFLLNCHYSDTWADPASQTMPKAWEGKPHPELVQAVFEYLQQTYGSIG